MLRPKPLTPHSAGIAALLLGTLLWSTSFVVTKGIIHSLAPSIVILGRFAIAAACFIPWLRLRPGLALAGIELGAWLIGGYGSQTVALLYTSAGRSAFIASLCVILVPLLLGLSGRRITANAWLAAVLAFVGIALLSYQGGDPNVGDLWSLLTAGFWAGYIIRLERFAKRHATLPLTAVQLWSIVVLALAWVLLAQSISSGSPAPLAPTGSTTPFWIWLIYLGLMTTALPTWLQTLGQMRVSPPEAAIIFTLEPVGAAILAFLFLGEALSWGQLVGAALILVAMITSQLPTQA